MENSKSASAEVLINLKNVSKLFNVYQNSGDRLKQFFLEKICGLLQLKARKIYSKEFWALRNVSFEIRRGESWAIIGKNGSGKSTLLQIICGVLSSTSGEVMVKGKVAGLLELGSGFNPEFTGRENAVLNAMLHGFSAEEVSKKLPSIIKFAELEEFIDQPIKTYSSGMVLRLAFAVIAYVEADILIIDEALAVGDAFFSQKCFRFLADFKLGGGTLLFVSHDMSAVTNLCDHAIYIKSGELVLNGAPKAVCAKYFEHIYEKNMNANAVKIGEYDSPPMLFDDNSASIRSFSIKDILGNICQVSALNLSSPSFGSGGINLLSAGFYDDAGNQLSEILTDSSTIFKFQALATSEVNEPSVGFLIKNSQGQILYCESTTAHFSSDRDAGFRFRVQEKISAQFKFLMPNLNSGDYFLSIAISDGTEYDHVQRLFMHEAIIINVRGRRLQFGSSGVPSLQLQVDIASPNS